MEALKAVYPEAAIQARLLDDLPLSLADISAATLAVVQSRHYFADHDDLQVISDLVESEKLKQMNILKAVS